MTGHRLAPMPTAADLRQEIAAAIAKVRFAAASHELNVPAKYLLDQETDAVMCIVGPLAERLGYYKDGALTEKDRADAEARAVENLREDVRQAHAERDLARRARDERFELALWLHAEAVWQRDQFRANEVENAELANDIFMAAGSKLASAVVLPEPVQRLVDWHLSCFSANVSPMPPQSEVREAMKSWRPATVEAAPTTGIALADELWPEPCAECETTGRNCSAHADATGVSGTGTEVSDA